MGRAASPGVPAVVQAHGAFDQQQVRGAARAGGACRHAFEYGLQAPGKAFAACDGFFGGNRWSLTAHPGIQIGGGLTRDGGVKGGVYVVRAGFGGTNREAARGQGTQKGKGDRGLARIAARTADDDAGYAHLCLVHRASGMRRKTLHAVIDGCG